MFVNIAKLSLKTFDRIIGPPSEDEINSSKRYEKYRALDTDGICSVGHKLVGGSIMVNKEQPINTSDQVDNTDIPDVGYKPSPLTYKSSSPSYVDKVLFSEFLFNYSILC